MRSYSKESIAVELPRLLQDQGWSLRDLASEIEVDQSYLSRVLGAKDAKAARPPSRKLLLSIAEALGVEPEHFREYREMIVIDAIREDPRLVDQVYRLLSSRG